MIYLISSTITIKWKSIKYIVTNNREIHLLGESIQKMLANLPAKRSTRKVLQENAARSQGRLRNVSFIIITINYFILNIDSKFK
jgi:hypothetical protein